MLLDILKQINWIDILLIVMAVRIIYIGAQTGFVTELMKLLATCASLFVAFHYYASLSSAIEKNSIAPGVLQAMAFVVLWLVTFFICKLVREGLFMLFTVEAQSALDKWGAAVLGSVRALLSASLLLFVFLVTAHPYFQSMTARSLSHKYVLQVAPRIYAVTCDRVVTMLFPNEKKNPAVARVMNSSPKK